MRKFIFGFISGFWSAMVLAEWTGVNEKPAAAGLRESELRAEVERLREDCSVLTEARVNDMLRMDAAEAERDTLRAVVAAWDVHWSGDGLNWHMGCNGCTAIKRARAALSVPPTPDETEQR